MSPHVCILSVRCILCSYDIQVGEKVAAVLGTNLTYSAYVSAFDFPKHGHDFVTGTVHIGSRQEFWRVCRHPGCEGCQKSPEAFAFHTDCFQLLKIGSPRTTPEDIWLIAAWSSPFPGAHYEAPSLWALPESMPNTTHWDPADEFFTLFWRLLEFIPELRRMIMEYSHDSPVWRYAVVLGWKAELLEVLQTKAIKTLLPRQLNNWTRKAFIIGEISGKDTVGERTTDNYAVIRIGLDRLGIKSIGLLEDRLSTPDENMSGFPWYIVEDICRLDDFKIVTNGTFIRLLPSQSPQKNISLYNTPSPADPALCQIIMHNGVQPERLRCISFDNHVLGLHVLASWYRIYGIYPHVRNDSAILKAYRKVPPRQKQGMVWLYFPLAAHEAIRKAWVRQETGSFPLTDPCLIISTTHGREYTFGFYIDPNNERFELRRLSSTSINQLIVGDPNPGNPVFYFGAYCTTAEKESTPRLIRRLENTDGMRGKFYHSQASLENVQQVYIFFGEGEEDKDGPDKILQHCIGILLEYTDGSREALGQCRLGYSPSIRTKNPIEMHWKKVSFSESISGINIRFSTVDIKFDGYNSPGWQGSEMIGTVTWWFNDETNHISFGGGRDE